MLFPSGVIRLILEKTGIHCNYTSLQAIEARVVLSISISGVIHVQKISEFQP
jgi:hypothetical protein